MRLCLDFFDSPPFEIGEIGDLSVVFPFSSSQVEIDFDVFVQVYVFKQITSILYQLDFHEIVPLGIFLVFHLNDKFPFLETIANLLGTSL